MASAVSYFASVAFSSALSGWRAIARFTTYNFEVADWHTYFVGEPGVWVHNSAQACERAFSIWKRLKGHEELDDFAAFRRIEELLPNATSETKGSVVTEIIKSRFPDLDPDLPVWTSGKYGNASVLT